MNRDDVQNALFGPKNIEDERKDVQSKLTKLPGAVKLDKMKSIENTVMSLLVKEGFEMKKIVPVVAAFMDNLNRAI